MRTINLTIKFEDNDLVEYNVRNALKGLLGDAIIDIKTLPNTDHLKEDKVYLEMRKKKKADEKALYKYVDSNRKK